MTVFSTNWSKWFQHLGLIIILRPTTQTGILLFIQTYASNASSPSCVDSRSFFHILRGLDVSLIGSLWTCVHQAEAWRHPRMPQPMQQFLFTFGLQQAGRKWGNEVCFSWRTQSDFIPSAHHPDHPRQTKCSQMNPAVWILLDIVTLEL